MRPAPIVMTRTDAATLVGILAAFLARREPPVALCGHHRHVWESLDSPRKHPHISDATADRVARDLSRQCGQCLAVAG